MITLLLIFVPLAAAVLAYSAKNMRKVIRLILLAGAALHSMLTLLAFTMLDAGKTEELSFAWKETGLLGLDTLGMIFLSITSLLFLIVSIHTLFWLPAEEAVDQDRVHNGTAHDSGLLREHIFLPCLLAFLSMMTLVICSRNFGLLWVAVEATTLVSAPLICFHRSPHSLEAMWKYLLICSVGIGLALFGTMLTGVAGQTASGALGLNFDTLKENAGQLHTGWFKAAFIFILVGYGTKMGLAPFHTWLPDAHSEAPGTVSALLSGSLLNCSFLGIIRFCTITPEVLKPFCNGLLVALGLLSLAVAAFFIIRQSDFKRMLAYSSVEHMGLAVILWGIGAESVTMFHLCGHSVIKMTLFLTAGNILLAYGTRSVSAVGGMFGTIPKNAVIWITGLLLICGTPPSPLFVTEFLLVRDAPLWLGVSVLVLLFAVFAGMSMACLRMAMGKSETLEKTSFPAKQAERLWVMPFCAVVIALVSGTMLLGILNIGRL